MMGLFKKKSAKAAPQSTGREKADPPFGKPSASTPDKAPKTARMTTAPVTPDSAMPKPDMQQGAAKPEKKARIRKTLKRRKGQQDDELRPTAPIVPPSSIAGRSLVFVIAIMSFLACLTVGTVSLIHDAAKVWTNDIAREVSIQLRPVDGQNMEQAIARTIALARKTQGINNAKLVSAQDTVALLEPWLGSGLQINELPIPRLIVLEIDADNRPDLTTFRAQLTMQVPGSSLDDHRAWRDRLATMANTFVLVGLGVLLLVLAATVLSVVFATQGAMIGNRDIVGVLHFIGARDRFIAKEFQHRFLILGLKGAILGGIASILVFLASSFVANTTYATPETDQLAILFGHFSISMLGYLGITGIIVLVAGLTAITSRWAVFHYLANVE